MNARGMLWVAGALAVSAHAAVAVACWQAGLRHPPARAGSATPTAPHVVRLSSLPSWRLAPAPAVTRHPEVAGPMQHAHAAPSTAFELPPLSVQPSPVAASPLAQEATWAEPDSPHGEAPTYLPRHALDEGPNPRTEVLIHFPPSTNDDGRRSGRFRLFIDEQGVVQAVLPLDDEATLTPAMVVSTRTAFLGTVFSPGIKGGRPVRSRIDVEVNFDALPLPPLTADNQAPAGPGA